MNIHISIDAETPELARDAMAGLLGTKVLLYTPIGDVLAAARGAITAVTEADTVVAENGDVLKSRNAEMASDIDAAVAHVANPARVPGQPAPGKQRRTKAEIAEDDALAAKQITPAIAAAHAEIAGISTGEERVDPNHPEDSAEVQAADAVDEAAETAATKAGLTLDDVRKTVGLYVTKYGMAGATDVATILGCKIIDIPETPEALADAISKVEQAIEGNPFERAVVGAAPAAATIATATKADVNAALLRYAAKYDGTSTDQAKMAFTMIDGPECLSRRFGAAVRKASDIPADPASYAQAVADIEQMIELNPFKRTAPVAA